MEFWRKTIKIVGDKDGYYYQILDTGIVYEKGRKRGQR